MIKQVKADLALTTVAFFWGASYYMIDVCLSEMGPMTLNAYRFLIAFCVAATVAFRSLRGVNKKTLSRALILGVIVTLIYITANYGVMYTSLSNAGFLCALAVVFTPIMAYIIFKKKPEKKLIFVVVLCCVSVALLTLNEEMKPAIGDLLCLICSFLSSFHLLFTESFVKDKDVNPFQLGVYQLFVVGALSVLLAFFLEEPGLPQTIEVGGAIIFLSVFCSGIAFVALTIAQQYTTASHTGVIFTLEPVFAGFMAFFLAGEVLLPRGYAGAAMLIIGILVMEVNIKKIIKR